MISTKAMLRTCAVALGDAAGAAALPQHASPMTRRTLYAERKALGEDLRQTTRADAALRLIDPIRGTIEGGLRRAGVEDDVRRARIAVARLSDASRIEEQMPVERVRLFRDRR